MDKYREPLFSFKWRRDVSGYALAPGGASIVRLMGGMDAAYDPSEIKPPLHYVFANLSDQVLQDGETPPALLNDDFVNRRFSDMDEALLAFVREYGFIGSPTWGDDAISEPLEYLKDQRRNLSCFVYFAPKTPNESIYRLAPPMNVRLVPGRGETHRICIAPQSLIAWMWLRFLQDYTNGVKWGGPNCKYCGNPMGRGPGGHREDAIFCKDQCRKRFHRSKDLKTKAGKPETTKREKKS